MRVPAIIAMVLLPTLSSAHSMSPGFEVEYAVTTAHTKTYTITNDYDFPAVYKIEVFNKDFTPATDWRADKILFNILPRNSKQADIQFKATATRKLIVCSTLTEIGKENEKASIISRVCSRLIINGVTR